MSRIRSYQTRNFFVSEGRYRFFSEKQENGYCEIEKRLYSNKYSVALVAQLDRAIASGAIGREFEPRRVHHFENSPPTGLLVGFFVFGADFETELVLLQCRRESTVFAFPSVFPMISRQILRGAEVAGFSIGEAKVGETHRKIRPLDFWN